MRPTVLLDTGPLVAFLHRRDRFHRWAVEQLNRVEPPLLACEAVLTEACFLVQKLQGGSAAVLEFAQTGLIDLPFHLSDELECVRNLMARYAKVPMALADACLVRMSEQYSNSTVLTLDAYFHIYRRHGRQVIPVIEPDELT